MLIAAHRELEGGQEPTLETFTAHLVVIRHLIEDLRPTPTVSAKKE
jgi:hypothetical protein